jgi:hypothetical protein
MITVADRWSSGYGDETTVLKTIFEIRDSNLWFNNRTWVVHNEKMGQMIDGLIKIGANEIYKRAEHVIRKDPSTKKKIQCTCDYCSGPRSHHITFRGQYFAIKAGESREYGYFPSIIDSTFRFAFNYSPTYKQLLQLAIAVVDEFSGTMLFQDIMHYGWSAGISLCGRDLKKCFNNPKTNAQEMLCAEIAHHDSSKYPHMLWRGNSSLPSFNASGDISCEGSDIIDENLDLFSKVTISLNEVDGKMSTEFDRDKFYTVIHLEIVKLNLIASKQDGGDVCVAAEASVNMFAKL